MLKSIGRAIALAGTALLLGVSLYFTQPKAEPVGPVSHWVFTKGELRAGAIRDETGRLPAQVTGEPVFAQGGGLETRPLRTGVVLRDMVRAGDPVLPDQDVTLAAWMRLDQGHQFGGILGAVRWSGHTEQGFILGYNENVFTWCLSGQETGSGKLSKLAGKTPFEIGRWFHVVGTYDGSSMKLYVNGKLDGVSNRESGKIRHAPQAPFVLGALREKEKHYALRGAVKEAWVYHRALPAAQVTEQFEANRSLAELPSAEPALHFIIAPYLQYPTRESIKILWETSVPGSSKVQYGIGKLDHVADGPKDVAIHEVPLASLQPNTPYIYKVSSITAAGATVTGPLMTFQTAVDPDSAFSFVAIGDTQKNPVTTAKIADLAWKRRPNFVIHLGDVVDNGRDKSEWVEELFRPCAELFGRVAVFPAIGNHEKNDPQYYKYFAVPAPKYYYRYRYGNADFFSIDTNKTSTAKGGEQYEWLDRELAKSDAKWKIVYHHHPSYSSDNDDYGDTFKGEKSRLGDRKAQALIPLYEKHKVDIVFNGHIHVYERSWPVRGGKVDRQDGTIYLTSGGGGASLEDFTPTPTWFKAQARSVYHYCYVTIHGGRLSLRAFDDTDMLFDTLELDK
jgi:predicted phosphodiesterase